MGESAAFLCHGWFISNASEIYDVLIDEGKGFRCALGRVLGQWFVTGTGLRVEKKKDLIIYGCKLVISMRDSSLSRIRFRIDL